MKSNLYRQIACTLAICISGTCLIAQDKKANNVKAANLADTTKKAVKPKLNPNKKIKPYETVVNAKFKTQKGLFNVHRHRDTTYFEISDTLLKREILVINRLKKVPGNFGIFPGELLDENLIQFELGRDSTIRVRLISLVNEADPTDNIRKAVDAANINSIIATFPIVAYAKDSSSYVIDVTKFITEQNFINSVDGSSELLKRVSATPLKDVFIETVNTYPLNVELGLSKTMVNKVAKAGATSATVETNTSFLLLPKKPMQRRLYDPRVGYFFNSSMRFADDQHRTEYKRFISRWRLEPKSNEIEKWKRGELVEPKKQIVIYIDPATPKQWVPHLIQGINDWQVAFQQAGFKNAIVGKPWPENKPDMNMEDARYSMIHYFPSSVSNAYGPHTADPRSGEILHARIGWHHNVMDLLTRWYKVQASAADPAARKAKFDDKLMGQLIRFVSSHEVGHSLGLRHNFGSSSKTPVESLRDVNYLKKHGHTASIMDYARFNYVAQPEDNIPQQYLFPKVNDYDNWAIEWGYKRTAAKDADADFKIVKNWIIDRVEANPRLWFTDGEMEFGDPRAQTEDLGDNAMKASIYGIKNLTRTLANLKAWNYEEDALYEDLGKMHQEIYNQYLRYIGHVTKNLGGFNRDVKVMSETGAVFSATSKAYQLEAMDFLDKYVFMTQKWLIRPELEDLHHNAMYSAKDNATQTHMLGKVQINTLNTVLHDGFLHKILGNENRFPGNYALADHMSLLHNMIWRDLKAPKIEMDNFRRNLQKSYIGNLGEILKFKNVETADTDVPSVVKMELKKIQSTVEVALKRTTEGMNYYHLLDLQDRINQLLNPKK